MNNPIVLFIVEGEDRDYRFITEMIQCFFKGKYETRIISLAAAQNIYMLYQTLLKDNFETDVVEVLRDEVVAAAEQLEGIERQDISEVFLFFDYDIQEQNLSNTLNLCNDQVIENMLAFFDNETENGKLFISYPMVEALYDCQAGTCENFTDCYTNVYELNNYKNRSGQDNPYAGRHFKIEEWKLAVNVFAMRLQCLMSEHKMTYQWYRDNIDPETIYRAEKKLVQKENKIFVLSAFPEFLLEYFKIDFWNSVVKYSNRLMQTCQTRIKVG